MMNTLDNHKFAFWITVIIPVYNLGSSLEDTMNSVINQTAPFDQIEVVLIDDGSVDESATVIQKYEKQYENIKAVYQSHLGVSAARNAGLKNANGKYIMFLDGDDQITSDTMVNLGTFFDAHYNEVDLVTYPLITYRDSIDGDILPEHYRYKYLKTSGIYDLNQYPFVTQTTINIIIKNRFQNNILFREDMSFTEDQAFCFDNLKRIFKLGFCAEASYLYIKHGKSSSSVLMGAPYMFEPCMGFWEDLFFEYSELKSVPQYVQAAYVNDLAWKNTSNVLFPYHYRKKEDFDLAVDRIKDLLDKVDIDVIMSHPALNEYHKYFFLSLKEPYAIETIQVDGSIYLCNLNHVLRKIDEVELVIEKIGIVGQKIQLRGYFRSVLFNFCDDVQFKEKCLLITEEIKTSDLEVFQGAKSWYGCHTKTNIAWSFVAEYSPDTSIKEIWYEMKVLDCILPVKVVFEEEATFYERPEEKKIIINNFALSYENNSFYIETCSANELLEYRSRELDWYKDIQPDVAYLRQQACENRSEIIWLYYDTLGVTQDNGFYQFCSDMSREDGISRYYVCREEDLDYYKKEYKEFFDHIVVFGTHRHQILFLNCSKIITAYIENYNIVPFTKLDTGRVSDLCRYEVIYLQHGVSQAYAPWKYTFLGNMADRIVISTQYEDDIMTRVYHFPKERLIFAGMPRYSQMLPVSTKQQEGSYILYAPSWRSYLTDITPYGQWVKTEEKFQKSIFGKEIKNIFQSEEWQTFLKENDIKFFIQLHPIFQIYAEDFRELQNDWIKLAESNLDYSNCCLFVTDYSSYVFDYVRKNKTILYFFPDEKEFYSGMNGYYRLTLPLEDGFGPITQNSQELLEAIIKLYENNWIADSVYVDRTINFFGDVGNACENIYNAILKC